MTSVADALRRSLRERLMGLSPDERVALTARLADADLDIFCAAQRSTRLEGRRLIECRRSAGRRRSCVNRGTPA